MEIPEPCREKVVKLCKGKIPYSQAEIAEQITQVTQIRDNLDGSPRSTENYSTANEVLYFMQDENLRWLEGKK